MLNKNVPYEEYAGFNAFNNSFIHFTHLRQGDREGIFDSDLSIGKTSSGWLLSYERKTQRDTVDDYVFDFYIDDYLFTEDFFEKYSKKEFSKILKVITHSEFELKDCKEIKKLFKPGGITSEWTESIYWSDIKEQLEQKEYFISEEYYSDTLPCNQLPLLNSFCIENNIDVIRNGIRLDSYKPWQKYLKKNKVK